VLAIAIVLALVPGRLAAANTYIYVNNDIYYGPNSVSAFSVGAGGVLTTVAGSPFATGGSGSGLGWYASNKAAATVVGNFLYVSNSYSGTVSSFSINTATGVLTSVPGSPFATAGGRGRILTGLRWPPPPTGSI
jgi:DNA-binding beta-propeller fold protein YncE